MGKPCSKRVNGASSEMANRSLLDFSWVRSFAGVACMVFVLCSGSARGQSNAQTLVAPISSAELVSLDRVDEPVQVTLPYQVMRNERIFKRWRLRAEFTIADRNAAPLFAVYFVSLYDGGRVRVNGQDVGDVETSTPDSTVRHVRPYLFQIPSEVLRNGSNVLEVEWAARESLILLSRVYVGPAAVLRSTFEQRYFWQNTIAQAGFVHALVIAAILLIIFSMRRGQPAYLLMGLGATGCAIVVFVYNLPTMPAGLYPIWRFTHLTGIALFTNCTWMFLIRESKIPSPRYLRLCFALMLVGPLGMALHFALTGLMPHPKLESFWAGACGAAGLYPQLLLARALWTKWEWRKFIFLIATTVAMVVGIADVVLLGMANSIFGNFGYSLQIVSPLWLTALTGVLIADFTASLAAQQGQQNVMARQLDEQERRLQEMHLANQLLDRAQAINNERQRIMQDMHDGLGSQLISSLALSERGELNAAQTSNLLRECIDDLRLAIDTTTSADNQFSVACGNLRFRMEPRLRAAGIGLRWESNLWEEPDKVPVQKTLPLVRIMQEAFTNTLKHASAHCISVNLHILADELTMKLSDDGIGFRPDSVPGGKGLHGMQKRARGVGASLTITSDNGTCVTLVLPLQNSPTSET